MDPEPFLAGKSTARLRSKSTGLASTTNLIDTGASARWHWVPPKQLFQRFVLCRPTTAILKILCGVILLSIAERGLLSLPLARGWIAMCGVVLVLHFGLFDLIASGWRSRGVPVQPLMQKPLLARSVSDFWGKCWNTAFNEAAFKLAFRPLARRFGGPAAIIGVFLLSGLVHELVISVPAGGGYGLPTAYFLLQGTGLLLERTLFRRLQSGSPLNRLFTLLTIAAPAYFLFHPPFIHNVILPMLQAFGGN